eukprot:scaffold240096_cov45-Tisochrysis_lutea.AAC.1
MAVSWAISIVGAPRQKLSCLDTCSGACKWPIHCKTLVRHDMIMIVIVIGDNDKRSASANANSPMQMQH